MCHHAKVREELVYNRALDSAIESRSVHRYASSHAHLCSFHAVLP